MDHHGPPPISTAARSEVTSASSFPGLPSGAPSAASHSLTRTCHPQPHTCHPCLSPDGAPMQEFRVLKHSEGPTITATSLSHSSPFRPFSFSSTPVSPISFPMHTPLYFQTPLHHYPLPHPFTPPFLGPGPSCLLPSSFLSLPSLVCPPLLAASTGGVVVLRLM